jgi:hypothetical protein
MSRRRSDGRWLVGYLANIAIGIIVVLILGQFLPELLTKILTPGSVPWPAEAHN